MSLFWSALACLFLISYLALLLLSDTSDAMTDPDE